MRYDRDLRIWTVAEVLAEPDFTEVLVPADDDHRLTGMAYLLVRSETAAPREVAWTGPGGEEATLSVRPATLRPGSWYPLGHCPHDTVVGPFGSGTVSYLPSPRGLRVVAFTEHPGSERST